eukprot:s1995_g9.t1
MVAVASSPATSAASEFTSPASKYERLESNIGEGTYGKVHKAFHVRSGEIVAIKKAKETVADRDVGGIGFTALREVKVMQAIQHPNVMTCLDVFVEGQAVHLVMPYMDTDLKKIIEDESINLTEAHCKCLAQQVLQGLAALHERFFVHRDVTPNNVLLSFRTGIAKLSDFGFTRSLSSKRPMTTMCTTLWYRAPELLFGAKFYGTAVDLWRPGALGFERVPDDFCNGGQDARTGWHPQFSAPRFFTAAEDESCHFIQPPFRAGGKAEVHTITEKQEGPNRPNPYLSIEIVSICVGVLLSVSCGAVGAWRLRKRLKEKQNVNGADPDLEAQIFPPRQPPSPTKPSLLALIPTPSVREALPPPVQCSISAQWPRRKVAFFTVESGAFEAFGHRYSIEHPTKPQLTKFHWADGTLQTLARIDRNTIEWQTDHSNPEWRRFLWVCTPECTHGSTSHAMEFSASSYKCSVCKSSGNEKHWQKTCPRDGRPNCSLVDALEDEYSGKVTHFVSWCWGYTLQDFVSAVSAWLQRSQLNPDDVFLWVCFFCNNQYRIMDEGSKTGSDELKAVFETHLAEAGQMLVLLDKVLSPIYIQRAWCIFECYVCIEQEFSMTIILSESAEANFKRALNYNYLHEVRAGLGALDVRGCSPQHRTAVEMVPLHSKSASIRWAFRRVASQSSRLLMLPGLPWPQRQRRLILDAGKMLDGLLAVLGEGL